MKKSVLINSIIGALALTLMFINISDIIIRERLNESEHIYEVMAMCVEATDTGALLNDTEGNQWYVEVALEQGVEYLMYIDDCGNDDVEDDEIVNVWREVRY